MIVAVLLLNTPDAPDPGAANVTFTPETGLLPASFTVTASAFAKAVLIVADCGVVPAFAVIVVAAPTVFVSEKFTGVDPVAAAVTVYDRPAVALAVPGDDASPRPSCSRRATGHVHPGNRIAPRVLHRHRQCVGERCADSR